MGVLVMGGSFQGRGCPQTVRKRVTNGHRISPVLIRVWAGQGREDHDNHRQSPERAHKETKKA